jgi:hypothetical protein
LIVEEHRGLPGRDCDLRFGQLDRQGVAHQSDDRWHGWSSVPELDVDSLAHGGGLGQPVQSGDVDNALEQFVARTDYHLSLGCADLENEHWLWEASAQTLSLTDGKACVSVVLTDNLSAAPHDGARLERRVHGAQTLL